MYMERQDVKIKGKTMFEKFEIHGRWFLPNQEVEEGISGTLYYSPERITLNLDGIFEDEEDTQPADENEPVDNDEPPSENNKNQNKQ